jgi:phage tail sheath protein FI
MPEYLSPGVYVEEIDAGAKPIEGVSTSTAGMVGVTERGPESVPMLVTSFADFRRTYGGYLDRSTFADLWYLPHAVEGFFTNGGKRLFITRVASDQATAATGTLFGADVGSAAKATTLATTVRPGDAVLVLEDVAGLANGATLRADVGPRTEYLRIAATNGVLSGFAGNKRVRGLRIPLYRDQPKGAAVTPVTLAAVAPAVSVALPGGSRVRAGDRAIPLDDPSKVNKDDVLRLGDPADPEVVVVAGKPDDPADRRVLLTYGVARAYSPPSGSPMAVSVMKETPGTATALSQAAIRGDGLIVVDDATALAGTDFVRLGSGDTRVYDRVVVPQARRLRRAAASEHAALEPVRPVADATTSAGAKVYEAVVVVTAPATKVLAGATEIGVDQDPTGPVKAGELVRIGAGDKAEYRVAKAATAATIAFDTPLAADHAAGEPVVLAKEAADAATLVQRVQVGERLLLLTDPPVLAVGATVQVGARDSATVEYQQVDAAAPGVVVLNTDPAASPAGTPVGTTHAQAAAIVTRAPILTVRALDRGAWGNELRVLAERDGPVLETTVAAPPAAPGMPIGLGSVAGLEPGTVLEFGYTASAAGTFAKVTAVKGKGVDVSPAVTVAVGMPVRTREFKLTVEWIRQDRVAQSETFDRLSLDRRHSRYAPEAIGQVSAPPRISDRRPEGSSELVRFTDEDAANSETTIRLWPDLLTAPTATGQQRPFGRFLQGGGDASATIDKNATFVGTDNIEPAKRTGLQSLKNEPRISIVAIPGRTEQAVQQELINQCELMRYRFAVLDSVRGAPTGGATLADVQQQRQRYDTRYAALYYPWVTVADPAPPNGRAAPDLVVPPAGHVLGIYADTDVVRGVHKAPANAVVRGISGFQRKLTKAEQDLLNPSPVNINVLRDFREDNRGLRVWGARVAGSDTSWKYVNVRRLFIFLEASLDIGLQWVVFEPNDQRLWARVRQSATDFLTRVWRDGALMGRKAEEAFFVTCDETTMTPDDLALGKLVIVIGVAPVRPAEFVIVRIGQWAGGSEVQEL